MKGMLIGKTGRRVRKEPQRSRRFNAGAGVSYYTFTTGIQTGWCQRSFSYRPEGRPTTGLNAGANTAQACGSPHRGRTFAEWARLLQFVSQSGTLSVGARTAGEHSRFGVTDYTFTIRIQLPERLTPFPGHVRHSREGGNPETRPFHAQTGVRDHFRYRK